VNRYEKQSFIKIFLGYFISVAIFIIILGYLYFSQQKVFILQKVAMNMHQYILNLKQTNFEYTQDGYSFDMVDFTIVKRQLPIKKGNVYYKAFTHSLIVFVDAHIVDKELSELKRFTIILQISLTLFFAFISFILAKKSLQPMKEAFVHLDNFTTNLIHDLNTPITSILLNTTILKKTSDENSLIKINRIENSAKNISSLYENLEILLKGNKLLKDKFNLSFIIKDILDTYSLIYPHIKLEFNDTNIMINSNKIALKRIIDNIISNSCKYSKNENAIIKIEFTNNTLIIKDNGKGIKYPNKIFQRNYKETTNGYGIGMHIVYRLCDQLSHKIDIQSKQNIGTIITIKLI
jgi:two-component system OmpR family sensor kinase